MNSLYVIVKANCIGCWECLCMVCDL